MMNTERKHTVLVTGFGPFGTHVVNASWEAVKQLSQLVEENSDDIDLVIQEIPVVYDAVCNRIPQLWKEHKPMLVVHVGVSHMANCLTIESKAHNTGYVRPDVDNKYPDEKDVLPHVTETEIDVKRICEKVNESSIDGLYKACVSHDAGRYLCEFIYNQSLCIQPSNTLFVHVPDFNVYSSTQAAKGLYQIIRYVIEHIEFRS